MGAIRALARRCLWVPVFAVVMAIAFSPSSADAAIKLQFALWINDPNEIPAIQEIVKTYERLNPGVEIELIQQPWTGYHDLILTLALSGLMPDVLTVDRSYLPSFAEANLVQPVDHLVAKTDLDLQRDVAEVQSGTYRGRFYGIPIWGGPAIMVYNADIFDSVGSERPSELYARGEWTWDKVVEIGRKIVQDVAGDGTVVRWATSGPMLWEPDWASKVLQFGGGVINAERTKALIDQPESIAGLQFWADIANVYHIGPTLNEPQGDFVAGTRALDIVWASEAPSRVQHVDGAFEVDIVPQPAGPGGHYHIAGGVPVAISSTTPHPEEAFKFAVWFAMESGQWKLRGIPAAMDDIRYEYRDYINEIFANGDAVMHALSHPTQMEPSVGIHQVELDRAWGPHLWRLAAGLIPAEEAAYQIAEQINRILNSD